MQYITKEKSFILLDNLNNVCKTLLLFLRMLAACCYTCVFGGKETALTYAIDYQSIALTEYFLAAGMTVGRDDHSQGITLGPAAGRDAPAVVTVSREDCGLWGALAYAAETSNVAMVQQLLVKVPEQSDMMGCYGSNGYTLLMWAIHANHREIVEKFLEHSPRLYTCTGRDHLTVLMVAAFLGREPLMGYLLDDFPEHMRDLRERRGVAINNVDDALLVMAKDKRGMTASDYAKEFPTIQEMLAKHMPARVWLKDDTPSASAEASSRFSDGGCSCYL